MRDVGAKKLLLKETNEKFARVGHKLKRKKVGTMGSGEQGEYKRTMR